MDSWFFIAILALSLGAILLAARFGWSLRRLRGGAAGKGLRRQLRRLEILELEEDVLNRIAARAGAGVEACLASVVDFDRGIEGILEEASGMSGTAQVELFHTLRSLRQKLGFSQSSPQKPLLSTRNLAVGQKVHLGLLRGEKVGRHLAAAVFQVDEEGIIFRLDPGQEELSQSWVIPKRIAGVEVRFFRADECAYSFTSEFLEYRPRGQGFIRTRHPRRIERHQKRGFLRVPLEEPIPVRWFPARVLPAARMTTGEVESVIGVHQAMASSIGGGGLQVRVEGPAIQLNDWIEVRLPFLPPPHDQESCFARVVKVYQAPPEGIFGLEFDRISIRLQTAIVSEVERRHRALDGQTTSSRQQERNEVSNPS